MIRAGRTREQAETLALEALAYLADSPEALERFLASSGLDVAGLRQRASDPDVLRAVLEFLLTDDTLTAAFCGGHGLDPRDLHAAEHLLEQP